MHYVLFLKTLLQCLSYKKGKCRTKKRVMLFLAVIGAFYLAWQVLPPLQLKSRFDFADELKVGRRQIQTFDPNNN